MKNYLDCLKNENSLCSVCNANCIDDITHYFVLCDNVKPFWRMVFSKIYLALHLMFKFMKDSKHIFLNSYLLYLNRTVYMEKYIINKNGKKTLDRNGPYQFIVL